MFKLRCFIIFLTLTLLIQRSTSSIRKSRVGNRLRSQNVRTSTTTTTTTTTVAPETTTASIKPTKIPTNLLIAIGKETDLTKFFLKYVENTWIQKDNKTSQEYLVDSEGKPILVGNSEKLFLVNSSSIIPSNTSSQPVTWKPGRSGNRPGSTSQNNTAPIVMERLFTVCYPQNKTVPVRFPNLGPSYATVPSCVSVPRCGGCCILGGDTLVCEPTETVFVNHTIRILEYSGHLMPFREVGYEQFEAEEHTRCTCNCRVKQNDCQSVHHLYSESKCSCDCQNLEARTNCNSLVDEHGNSLRFWDEDHCSCKCHEDDRKECSSGYKYDEDETCDCILDEAI